METQVCYLDGADASLADSRLADAAARCKRRIAPPHRAQLAQLQKLITIGATVEAAMALIELELPQWKLRRIAYDEGDWHCALSKQRELPEWLDEAVETTHKNLAIAILGAFEEAVKRNAAIETILRSSVPPAGTRVNPFQPMQCENYC